MTPDALDDLVRARLEREAEAIDPRPLFERIMAVRASGGCEPPDSDSHSVRASGGCEPPDSDSHSVRASGGCEPPDSDSHSVRARGDSAHDQNRGAHAPRSPRRFLRRVALGFATAAAVALAFVGGVLYWKPEPAAAATPETLLREAQQTHQQPIDRCYLVECRTESDLLDETKPVTAQSRSTRLWTRGDRFWLESTNPTARWAWGRDADGGIWMAFGGIRRGVRLAPDEVPAWLGQACDTFSMRVETLLGDVLREFDLRREPGDGGTQVIEATLKPGRSHPGLRSARLEIDPETKAVRKLVLDRTRFGQPLATVTYTLVETRPQDDRKYQPEGHLPATTEIYTRDNQPRRRAELLTRWFGAVADGRK